MWFQCSLLYIKSQINYASARSFSAIAQSNPNLEHNVFIGAKA